MPSTEFDQTVFLSAPLLQVSAIQSLLAAATGRTQAEAEADFPFINRNGPGGQAGAGEVRLVAGVFSTEQIDAGIRALFEPGGSAYLLGGRSRRGLNEATETTTHEAGKLQVTVLGVGDSIPENVDWSVTRMTIDRFRQELGVTEIEVTI